MQNFRCSLSIYHVVFYKPGLHFKKRKGTSKAEQRATGAANDHTGALAPAHGPLEATGRPGDTILYRCGPDTVTEHLVRRFILAFAILSH